MNNMRIIYISIITLLCSTNIFAQNKKDINAVLLSSTEVSTLLSNEVKAKLGIVFPVFRVYKYNDKMGKYYLILTENKIGVNEEKEAVNNKIKAIGIKEEGGVLAKILDINDAILKNENDESSIWFWTKYIDFNDYDQDGIADAILVYGTSGSNGYDDGRIKVIVLYKGQKIAIRHQNGILDDERETQVDKQFYSLPIALQNAVKKKMDLISENDHGTFPDGWQDAMKKQKLIINER